jgi:hypothetical protein
MFYSVFSTNDSPYMQWQSDLLEYSWKRVEQDGVLIRLVATDTTETLPSQKYAQCVATQCWDVHPDTKDAYPIYNKPASLLEWVYRDRPEGTVLLLDPDCVFRMPVKRRVAPGYPASQAWIDHVLQKPGPKNPFGLGTGFSFLADYCAKTDVRIDPVMIPTLIHTSDLRRMCARWLQLCGIVRDNYRNDEGLPIWEADMYAYLVACAEYDLQHEPISLGICTNWDPVKVPGAPIIHYCQPITDKDGIVRFGKHRYEPWNQIVLEAEPLHDYGGDLVNLINDYVSELTGNVRPLSHGDRPMWRKGVMEGRVLDEMLLERPADGASLWVNATGIAIWELCDGSRSIAEIGLGLSNEFSAVEQDITSDVYSTVARLREYGFVEIA